MRVKPKDGMRVRHPASKLVIPDDGINVDAGDLYWRRRIEHGDVEVVGVDPERPVAAEAGEHQS